MKINIEQNSVTFTYKSYRDQLTNETGIGAETIGKLTNKTENKEKIRGRSRLKRIKVRMKKIAELPSRTGTSFLVPVKTNNMRIKVRLKSILNQIKTEWGNEELHDIQRAETSIQLEEDKTDTRAETMGRITNGTKSTELRMKNKCYSKKLK